MLKNCFFLWFLLVSTTLVEAKNTVQNSENPAFFEGTWHDLLLEAQAQHKPILLDFQTSWCGPCRWMERNVFMDENVKNFLSERVIVYKVDAEKGQGIQLADIYEPNGFPTYICLTWNGDVLHKFSGLKKPKEFMDEVNFGISTTRKPDSQQDKLVSMEVVSQEKSIVLSPENLKDVEFLRDYIETNGRNQLIPVHIMDTFFDLIPENERLKIENVELFVDFNANFNSKTGKFIYDNRAAFSYRNTRSLQTALINHYEDIVASKSIDKLDDYIGYEMAFSMPSINFSPRVRAEKTKLRFLEDIGDEVNLKPAIKSYVGRYLLNYDFAFLESTIESSFKNIPDSLRAKSAEIWSEREMLLKKGFINEINEQMGFYALKYAELANVEADLDVALEWSKISHEYLKKPDLLLNTAKILAMQGKVSEAAKLAKQSLHLAQKNKENTFNITRFLEEFKN
jgi:thiol-disulfide isomerase/thioredoxin